MRRVSLVAIFASLLAGCGAHHSAPAPTHGGVPIALPGPIGNASCWSGRAPAGVPSAQEVGVYRAGRLVLVTGNDLAQLHGSQLRARSGHRAIAVVTGDRPVVLGVDSASRHRFSLRFGRAARDAVRFPACGGRVHRFAGEISFSGEGCARLHVTEAGGRQLPMLIPIGNTLRDCPSTASARRLSPSTLPFLGIACGIPNSIACDRIGVGVNLRERAALVAVHVNDRLVTLSPPLDPPDDLWLGYLSNAGLTHGPHAIGLPPGDPWWFGNPEVDPRVLVTVFFEDGSVGSLSAPGFLHPGFG
jgi:hypothetical protein